MAEWCRRSDTRNPLDILIERESRTCAGCVHKSAAWGVAFCVKLSRPAVKRCKQYKGVS